MSAVIFSRHTILLEIKNLHKFMHHKKSDHITEPDVRPEQGLIELPEEVVDRRLCIVIIC